MLLAPDPFDPNLMDFGDEHECRVYADDLAQVWAVVDRIDYQWAIQWRWHVKMDKHGRKAYLARNTTVPGTRSSRTIFLHVAIMERTGIVRPPHHTMTDHENGDSLCDRRFNLRWATPSMNRRNIAGQRSMRI